MLKRVTTKAARAMSYDKPEGLFWVYANFESVREYEDDEDDRAISTPLVIIEKESDIPLELQPLAAEMFKVLETS